MAEEAAPPLANVDVIDKITCRMGPGPVNLLQATSAKGRGVDDCRDGESAHRLDDKQAADTRIQAKTSDDPESNDHRGNLS